MENTGAIEITFRSPAPGADSVILGCRTVFASPLYLDNPCPVRVAPVSRFDIKFLAENLMDIA